MSSLQLALIVLGAVVLVALVVHSSWQSRRAGIRKATPRVPAPAPVPAPPIEPHLGPPPDPVLAPAPMPAPALDETPLPDEVISVPDPEAAPAVPAYSNLAVPQIEDQETMPAALHRSEPVLEPLPPPVPRRVGARLDPLIDAMASLSIDVRFSGDNVLGYLPSTRRAGSKPFLIEGQNEASGEWEPPQAGHTYREFQAGVQLANRTGALNEIEYSEFVQKVQTFADTIGATTDFPDMLDAVGRARELDQFAGQHDAQLACHLHARGAAWSVAYIQQHAGRHGFVPGVVSGRLVLPAIEEGAPPVLTLQFDSQAAFAEDPNLAAVRDVTLTFDVPQTSPLEKPFQAWQASALALALGMDAAVVDDNGQPLSAAGFESIGQELDRLYEALEARDLAAGSPAARRLFS